MCLASSSDFLYRKVWGARYTLGARYLSKNTVYPFSLVSGIKNYCCCVVGVCIVLSQL
jgi:hypothetical protein